MDNFIQQLLSDQGVASDINPEVRAQLVQDLSSRATDFVNRGLINAMSDEAVEHFNTMLDDPSITPEQVQQFVDTNVANKEQVVANALVEFRALYLGDKA
ncbi:hypothetical protein BH09PAT3_BH09PAT3_4590 [soil metagenome]